MITRLVQTLRELVSPRPTPDPFAREIALRDRQRPFAANACQGCGMAMVTGDADYTKPYCSSWLHMEGGCPPAPVPAWNTAAVGAAQ